MFVGIHNKPGYEALDSRTKSGKVIDKIIARVSAECEKKNLYPVDYMPTGKEKEQLIGDFEFEDDALYIGLGDHVCKAIGFLVQPNLISIYHPGYVMRRGIVDEYVSGISEKINSLLS